jgi:AcrR family transcriptional regulator
MPRPADPRAHQALLEAARAEFAREGLERARVQDITRRAGVSKGAFYLHFRTKQEAFRELLQRFTGAIEDHARARQEAEALFERNQARRGGFASALDFECEADAKMLDILWRNRQIMAVIDTVGGSELGRLVADFRRRMRELVTARIRERQRLGRARRDVAAQVAADLVVGAFEYFGRHMVEMREKPDIQRWARSFLTVLYEGLLPRSAPARPGSRRGARGRP